MEIADSGKDFINNSGIIILCVTILFVIMGAFILLINSKLKSIREDFEDRVHYILRDTRHDNENPQKFDKLKENIETLHSRITNLEDKFDELENYIKSKESIIIQPIISEIRPSINLSSDYKNESEYQKKYIEIPEREGYFLTKNLKDQPDIRSVYEIKINYDKRIGYFKIINSQDSFQSALDNPNGKLKPACEYLQDPPLGTQKIIFDPEEKGELRVDDGNLIISKKLKIKFG